MKGTNFDGHDYIKEAIEKGACMIFVEKEVEPFGIPIVKVENTEGGPYICDNSNVWFY